APAAHHDEGHDGTIGSLVASILACQRADGDMGDGVGQHGGEFVLVVGSHKQAGGDEYVAAGKGRGLVKPGPLVFGQFERVGKACGGCLDGESLPEFVKVGGDRGGIGHVRVAAILRGKVRAEGSFFLDAVDVGAALGAKGGARQQESEQPHTSWWHKALPCASGRRPDRGELRSPAQGGALCHYLTSTSWSQSGRLRTSRGLLPSGGPMMPSRCMQSSMRAARP